MPDKTTTTTTTETTGASAEKKPELDMLVPPGLMPPVPLSMVKLDRERIKKGLAYYLTLGIRGLLGSKKGSFALLVLLVCTVAVFFGKVNGSEFVAALTVISGIYSAASAAVDIRNSGNSVT